jgi:exodeoxyribonuclease VIII
MQSELPDGIYLGLSFEDYLAAPRVSSGNLTDMIESPSAYWANSPMNPDREEREESEAMKLGRAYHAARLEPDTFEELYVRELVAKDYDDPTGEAKLLTNSTQVGETLAALGETKKRSGENARDQALRLDDALQSAPDGTGPVRIWLLELERWQEGIGDKTPITPKAWDEIKRDAARIRMNPEMEALISGGLPEVSILWTDEATGIKCKCRPDYLGSDWITHLKTWDMKTAGKPGNRAVVDAFKSNGYYRTGWFYLEGLNAMPGLKFRTPEGKIDKQVPEPVETAWMQPKRWDNWFLFVRRSGIPDIRAREIMYFGLPRGVEEQSIGTDTAGFKRSVTVLGRKADMEVRRCLQQIAECSELYGRDGSPWFPRDMIGRIEDEDFSDFWLDSVEEPR